MRPNDRTRRTKVLLVLAANCSGCVSTSVDGAAMSFHYSLWWAFAILAVCLGTLPAGLLVRKRNTTYGWLIIAAGAFSLVLFAPIAFQERVFVDAGAFHVRSGLWGSTANLDIAFDAVTSIAIVQDGSGGRSSRLIDVLVLTLKDGQRARLPLNNDIKITSAKEILEIGRAHV